MNELGGHTFELWNPAAHVVALWIELHALGDRVEHAKVWLRVASASRRPLPVEVVLRPIAVGEVLHVVRFAATVVDEQVLGKEAGRDHSRPVVHEALAEQLARCSVYDRITRASERPGVPGCR